MESGRNLVINTHAFLPIIPIMDLTQRDIFMMEEWTCVEKTGSLAW